MTPKLVNCNKWTVEVKIYFIWLISYSARIFKKDRQCRYPINAPPSLKIPQNNEKGNFSLKDSILFFHECKCHSVGNYQLNNKNFRTRREIYSSKQERHQNDNSDDNLVHFLLILDKLRTSF